ncbi:NAD-dependent epimerase/dehydratase family protein [Shimia sp. R9_2]|uniref:NAD-dependent epimerase/dehydratase family protein n=1 Tax=Shimia sp. R9_2 TaxID=2821112 RepID=UPI001ADBD304|nr:NAD-dependent epimerase/dehydratase family protein [Shimia sp. R9_2]MBO9395785.1 NAD-dependent epimerase/dehydratase family protein [Shimia sp. R9_2]
MTQGTITVDTSSPVLVTGATGYVAGWIVKGLLEAGATVHAAVRDPGNAAKVAHLTKIADQSDGTLKLFAADLLQEGSYAEAMQGCEIVFHTASPFTARVDDPQKELVDPALNGTRNVLDQASATESVRRVVLTSSVVSIYTDAVECADAPGGQLTEAVWNTSASLEYQPYSLSKTLAEKAAWEIADAQDQWKLVVINPALVIGPSLQKSPTSESFHLVQMLASGAMKSGAPRYGMGVVDVRDVAQAHLAAAYLEEAEGRHIVSAQSADFFEMAEALRPRFGKDYALPTRVAPKWLVWLLGPSMDMPRKMVSRNVNVRWKADNSKSKRALGMTYRPMRESLEDMMDKMISDGAFAAK